MKTAGDLGTLTRQKTWDKDVVLWVGAEHALLHILRSRMWCSTS
jgi:hypothetical protein